MKARGNGRVDEGATTGLSGGGKLFRCDMSLPRRRGELRGESTFLKGERSLQILIWK